MTGPSFWHDSLPQPVTPRPTLPGDLEADVVIVGAGYTGLWTAYYLKKADPALRVVVLESEYAGFGASGPQRRLVLGAVPLQPEQGGEGRAAPATPRSPCSAR